MSDENRAPPLRAEEPESPVWKAVKIGAKWGSLAGFVLGQLYVQSQSIGTPFGSIYGGNMLLALGIPLCIGAALGAGLGWLNTRLGDADDDSLPRSRPFDPYE